MCVCVCVCVCVCIEINVPRWCPFVHLLDTPFRNSPYAMIL